MNDSICFWGHLDSRMNFVLDRDRVGIWHSGGFKDLESQEVHCLVCSSDNLACNGWQYIEMFIAGLSWWQKRSYPVLKTMPLTGRSVKLLVSQAQHHLAEVSFLLFILYSSYSKMKLCWSLSVQIIHALDEIKLTSPKNSFLPKMSLRDKCL